MFFLAKTFIRRCLKINPTLRPTIEECLEDPWLKSARERLSLKSKSTPLRSSDTTENNVIKSSSGSLNYTYLLPIPNENIIKERQKNLLPCLKQGIFVDYKAKKELTRENGENEKLSFAI